MAAKNLENNQFGDFMDFETLTVCYIDTDLVEKSIFFENVEIKYIELDEKKCLLFTSVRGLPTQIYDLSKNKRNYKKFTKNLSQKSNS